MSSVQQISSYEERQIGHRIEYQELLIYSNFQVPKSEIP